MRKLIILSFFMLILGPACGGSDDIIEQEKEEKVPGPSSFEKEIQNISWKRAEIVHSRDTHINLFSFEQNENDIAEKYQLSINTIPNITSKSGTYDVSSFQLCKYKYNSIEFVLLPNYSVQEKYGDYGYITLNMTGKEQAKISIFLKNLEDEVKDYINSYNTEYEGKLTEGTILVY